MAKFFFKSLPRRFVLTPDAQQVITTTGGPQVINIAAKILEIKKSELGQDGSYETNDPEVIARLKRDPQYGTSEIIELGEKDQEAIKIHAKKDKEAIEEIKKLEAKDVRRTNIAE